MEVHTRRMHVWRMALLPLTAAALLITGSVILGEASAAVPTTIGVAPISQATDGNIPRLGKPETSGSAVITNGKVNPPAAPYVILYDQYNNASVGSGSISQDFETANDAFDSQLADDFIVPSGQTWQVTEVDAQAVYFNGAGPALKFQGLFLSELRSSARYTCLHGYRPCIHKHVG